MPVLTVALPMLHAVLSVLNAASPTWRNKYRPHKDPSSASHSTYRVSMLSHTHKGMSSACHSRYRVAIMPSQTHKGTFSAFHIRFRVSMIDNVTMACHQTLTKAPLLPVTVLTGCPLGITRSCPDKMMISGDKSCPQPAMAC